MSLAPAGIRGAFLRARLAVNGIQCAARSLGTLTAFWRGLLSNMGASCSFWGMVAIRQASSFAGGMPRAGFFESNPAILTILPRCFRASGRNSEVGGTDPEYFVFRVLGFKP